MKNITQIVRDAPQHWVGDGFPVRSLFSYQDNPAAYSPFLLLDYADPYEFPPADQTRGVGQHPHRGFETVTIVYQGELAHRDSTGTSGTIGPGDVQWMTAAGGILHEEYHSPAFTKTGGTFEVAQLWVNLPAREKLTPPRYQDLRKDAIPTVELAGAGNARIIAGEFNGTPGPARTVTRVNLWDLDLNANQPVDLPIAGGDTAILLVRSGSLRVGEEELSNGQLALFDQQGTDIRFETLAPTKALLLSGEPLNEPIAARGPFVMNTDEEIHQAIQDFQSGRMGSLT